MSTLNYTNGFTVQIGSGPVRSDGSTSIPTAITVGSLNGTFDGALATATPLVLWNTATAPVSTFTIGYVFSDVVGLLEFQAGSAASNSNLQLLAGVLQPFPGTGLAYNASGGFAGAVTAFTKVTLKNTSGSTANVRAWFFAP